jgi:hypothetical protein
MLDVRQVSNVCLNLYFLLMSVGFSYSTTLRQLNLPLKNVFEFRPCPTLNESWFPAKG